MSFDLEMDVLADSERMSFTRVEDFHKSHNTKDALKQAVREGLLSAQKWLPFAFFYDEMGSALFEKICKLPEYYLTRAEDSILASHANEMVADWPLNGSPTIVELGSGSAEKTKRLISAGLARYGSLQYVPIDVSESAVEESSKQLLEIFPKLRINAYIGDYHACLSDIGRRFQKAKLIVFLGSSLGNYEPDQAEGLLAQLAFLMNPQDRLLLGTDLDKSSEILEAAYDDSQGVTARFNKNLLVRLNRELQADFNLANFEHRAIYNRKAKRVEMHLISKLDQVVIIPEADLRVEFAKGESIHTENSHKYSVIELQRLAGASGFEEERSWSDSKGQFRVQRWRLAESTGF